MKIAIPLFPEVTALDAVGPYEVLQRLPGATVTFVGEEVGTVRSDNGFLGLSVDAVVSSVYSPMSWPFCASPWEASGLKPKLRPASGRTLTRLESRRRSVSAGTQRDMTMRQTPKSDS